MGRRSRALSLHDALPIFRGSLDQVGRALHDLRRARANIRLRLGDAHGRERAAAVGNSRDYLRGPQWGSGRPYSRAPRSEERRVGKECRWWWWPDQLEI